MVSQQIPERQAVVLYKKLSYFVIGGLGVVIVLLVVLIGLVRARREKYNEAAKNTDQSAVNSPDNRGENETTISSPVKQIEPKKVDLQSVVNQWASETRGEKGVIIYDLNLDEIVGKYNADREFQTASLYKLFVIYEGYRRVNDGEWDETEVISSHGETIAECLDLAIRKSDSICAELIQAKIGSDALDTIVRDDYGIDVTVSELDATPTAVMQIMKKYYEHPEITDPLLALKMEESFLIQPATEYDWRQGLPQGFSDAALVYNKVGWSYEADDEGENGHWEIYNDAAIVSFTQLDRQYIVVVMTSGVDYHQIRQLGTMMEEAIFASYY